MIKLLPDEYCAGFSFQHGCSPVVKYVCCIDKEFCIYDKHDDIICSFEVGVSVYNNPLELKITIINFENFIDQVGQKRRAGSGKKCDFIVYDESNKYFVLNELSLIQSQYLGSVKGENSDGKRSYAIKQIQESIDKLFNVSCIKNFIDKKEKKVGLFSYRLSDEGIDVPPVFSVNMGLFGSVKNIYADISTLNVLSNGFEFHQRIYPSAYILK